MGWTGYLNRKFKMYTKMPKIKVSVANLEKMIELVSEERPLYDHAYPDRKLVSCDVWDSIAETIGQKGCDGLFWKKKWRNMRDMYVKKRKLIRTEVEGPNVVRAKKWHFMKKMGFLDEFISEEYSLETSVPSPESDGESTEDTQYDYEILYDDTADAYTTSPPARSGITSPSQSAACMPSSSNNHMAPVSSSKRMKIKRENDIDNVSNQEDTLAEFLREHNARPEVTYPMFGHYPKTAEDAFFESCALRMRNLPAATKSILQLQIQQLFFNAENPTLPQVTITPLPSGI